MHSNIENDKENRETDPVLTEVNRKYTEIMNKINESEKKTLAYINAGWRSEVKPETHNIKKSHTTLVEFFKTASSVDTLRYAAVNKDDAELLDNINNLGYEEVEAKTSQLKSRIENESKKIKNAMEEMKIVQDRVVDEKIPEVVVREIACLDVDSQFVDVGVDELLIGKGIKVQMV